MIRCQVLPPRLVGWFAVLFYDISAPFRSFITELSHFDKFQTIQFRISIFFVYTVKCQTVNSNNSV